MTASAAMRSSQSSRAIPQLQLGILRKSSHRDVTVSPIESNRSRHPQSSTRRAYLAAKWYRMFLIVKWAALEIQSGDHLFTLDPALLSRKRMGNQSPHRMTGIVIWCSYARSFHGLK